MLTHPDLSRQVEHSCLLLFHISVCLANMSVEALQRLTEAAKGRRAVQLQGLRVGASIIGKCLAFAALAVQSFFLLS